MKQTGDHKSTKLSENSHFYLAFEKISIDLASGSKRMNRANAQKMLTKKHTSNLTNILSHTHMVRDMRSLIKMGVTVKMATNLVSYSLRTSLCDFGNFLTGIIP